MFDDNDDYDNDDNHDDHDDDDDDDIRDADDDDDDDDDDDAISTGKVFDWSIVNTLEGIPVLLAGQIKFLFIFLYYYIIIILLYFLYLMHNIYIDKKLLKKIWIFWSLFFCRYYYDV